MQVVIRPPSPATILPHPPTWANPPGWAEVVAGYSFKSAVRYLVVVECDHGGTRALRRILSRCATKSGAIKKLEEWKEHAHTTAGGYDFGEEAMLGIYDLKTQLVEDGAVPVLPPLTLTRGCDLPPDLRTEVLAAFIYRDTKEMPRGAGTLAGRLTDAEWLATHAFPVVANGRKLDRRVLRCDPMYCWFTQLCKSQGIPEDANPAWATTPVLQLIDGFPDTPLPILADALQEAGCGCAPLLAMLREDMDKYKAGEVRDWVRNMFGPHLRAWKGEGAACSA